MAALEEMTEDQVLDFADTCAETARRAEVDLLRAAYQWAVLHSPERLDPVESRKPGREGPRQLGGPGTPGVTEFAAASFGARIGRSPYAAARLIGDALDLHHRHRQLWTRVQAGEVRASYARHVATRTRDLQPVQAAYVDSRVVESADGRIPWSRFETLVEAAIAQADPETVREKEQRAAKATFAKKLPATNPDQAHGMASFLVRADLATIEAIAAAVDQHAGTLDPDIPADERQVQAVLELLTGQTTAHPDVQVHVHFYAGPDREPLARIEGHGPVTETWIRDVLGPQARFTIRPVLDLAGQAPVDSWEIPDRHRRAVRMMTPADTFPHAACTSRAMQVDHTTPYHQGGHTGIGNYGPMTTSHHRLKTHGGWQVRQPFPGIYLWRDPHGAHHLVDHTGTRRLPGTPPASEKPTPPERQRPLVLELWHTPHVDIDLDLAA